MNNNCIPLPQAALGQKYIVEKIENNIKSYNELKSHGIIPGARIIPLFSGPFKDPVAYEILGAVIALRKDDSKNIFVSSL